MRNKLIIGTGLILTVLGIYLVLLSQQPTEDAKAGQIVRIANVFGTATSSLQHFGTTQSTTTPVILSLNDGIDIIDFDIYTNSASTTNNINIQVLKSSLPRCAQTSGNNQGWVDAISTNAVSGDLTTITAATSTIAYQVPSALGGQGVAGKKYQLTNVNARCLKVYMGGTGVGVYMQAIMKTLSF